MPLTAGTRFGRYEITSRLGAGGMGEVYRALDRDLHREVAIKFLPAKYAAHADRLARFTQEARTASSLNHPNIITIHEVGQVDQQPFIVMELVEGETLRHLLQQRPLPPRRVLDIASQLADGLAKAHGTGIVHRDLKPENVMVTRDGLVKILDFGLAKLRTESAEEDHAGAPAAGDDAETRLTLETRAGTVVGTAGYMSPEQAAGLAVDHRSDQFSLGSVVYEMATGQRAFKRDSAVQTMTAIIEDEPEPLSAVNPSFPGPARRVVERCLSKDPDDRYASTLDLAHELHGIRDHLSETSNLDETPSGPRRHRWWQPAWRWVAAGAVVVGIALALPTISGLVRGRFGQPPLPAEKRVAVLPLTCPGAWDQATCSGMHEYLVARLGELPRFAKSLWLVPAADVRSTGVRDARQAHQRLGATLAVGVTVVQDAQTQRLVATLLDAVAIRQLRSSTKQLSAGVPPGDALVDAVIEILGLELDATATAALRDGITRVADASTLYAQGLGYTLYQQAQVSLGRYEQGQNLERAIALFNEAVAQDHDFALAYAGLAEAHLRLFRLARNKENLELAEQNCRLALDKGKTLAGPYVTLGMILAERGDQKGALDAFASALTRYPGNADAYRELALAQGRFGKLEEADSSYRNAIRQRPEAWANHNYYGFFLYNQGRCGPAEAEFRKALGAVPQNPRVLYNLGAALYCQKRTKEAEEAWNESLAAYPTGAAWSNIATLRYAEGRFAEALATLEKAVSIGGVECTDYRVWSNLGIVADRAGARARAIEAYRKTIQLAENERAATPRNPDLLVTLADSYRETGEPGKARALVDDAVKEGAKQPRVLETAVSVYEALGERRIALRYVEEALRLGLPIGEFEGNRSLEKLRSDPAYTAIVNTLAPKR